MSIMSWVAAPAGTMTQMARGRASCATRSATDAAPTAPCPVASRTFSGLRLYTTTRWPPRTSRMTMFMPMRPRPMNPSSIEASSVGEGVVAAVTRSRVPGAPQDPDGLRLGDEHPLRGAEEEARVDDAGDPADVAVERGGVVLGRDPAIEDPVAVVGDEWLPVRLAEGGPAAELGKPPSAEGAGEWQDLHREAPARAEARHELLRGHQDDLTPGGGRDDALARECAAVPLDEVEPGIDLVGAVDRDVEQVLGQLDHDEAQRGCERGRGARRGHALDPQSPRCLGGQRAHEGLRGPARAEPDAEVGPASRASATAWAPRRASASGDGAGTGSGTRRPDVASSGSGRP